MPTCPTPTLLSRFTSARRIPVRPPEAQGEGFADAFDDDTLWFDAFRSADNRHIVLMGPALFNLAALVDDASITPREGGAPLPFRLKSLDRHHQFWVEAPTSVTTLAVTSGLGRIEVVAGPNRSGRFAGRRVLMTLSRNNPLPWLLDWVRFNRDVNGADAVLLYDNGSTIYDSATLRAALAGIEGLAAAEVVDWPFRYGPQGFDAKRYWDSDFCQLGMLEHARWCFLPQARSVMNADIDELAFGRQSPFLAAEGSLVGMVRYGGRLVIDAGDAPSAPVPARRHRHYGVVLRRLPGRGRFGLPVDRVAERPKWTAVPSRCPARAQWHVHDIKGWPAGKPLRRHFGHRHFRPITTSWKYDREGVTPFDPVRHEVDAPLQTLMARVDWER